MIKIINYRHLICLIIVLTIVNHSHSIKPIDPKKTLVWGPGLRPDKVVLLGRYFFIHPVDIDGNKLSKFPPNTFDVKIKGKYKLDDCRYLLKILERDDGSAIYRYKMINECTNVKIEIKFNGTHVANSPYVSKSTAYPEQCYCPQSISQYMINNECPSKEQRIDLDLKPFKEVNYSAIRENLLKKYDQPGSVSICNYVIKSNKIYRNCYGRYVGFKMFMDAILLSLTRLVKLPDIEFFINLGDWPLSKKGGQQRTSGPYPIFSWCGSEDSYDIVLPSYDLTESSLENMGRVTLDMLSVQKAKYFWDTKVEKLFWRGRDANRQRLNLIDIARKYPDYINASITNFFFFRKEEEIYGPTSPYMSFMDFFEYKYQLNIDGTVAAYRFPYLLGGNSLVFKQASTFYEHFYDKLVPYKHYVPVSSNLDNLIEKIKWAKANDVRAREIMEEARKFANDNLLPVNVYCYHVLLFQEWSKRLISPVVVLPGMEYVKQEVDCDCEQHRRETKKDEL